MRIRVATSLLRGNSPEQARDVSRDIMVEVGRLAKPPIAVSLELVNDQNLKDLQSLGKNLSNGTYHGAVMWGTEYGWLRKKNPKLEAMVTVYNGADSWSEILLVRRKFVEEKGTLAELKGKTLARYTGESFVSHLLLEAMVRPVANGVPPKDFFKHVNYESAQKAVEGVANENADCVLMDYGKWWTIQEVYGKKLAGKLARLGNSPPIPPAALVGCKDNFEKVRRGLWDDLAKAAVRVHKERKSVSWDMEFMQFHRFAAPDKKFFDLVESSTKDVGDWSNHISAAKNAEP